MSNPEVKRPRPGWERFGVAFVIVEVVGLPLIHALARSLAAATHTPLSAVRLTWVILLVGGGVTLGPPWVAERLPDWLDGAFRRRRGLAILWSLLGLAAVAQTARLSTFMDDPSIRSASVFPADDWTVHHSCLSAYVNAAELSRRGVANVYESLNPNGKEREPVIDLGPFKLDAFEYPPPFLLLPRLGLLLTSRYLVLRCVWYAVEACSLAFALLALALWVGGDRGRMAALLAPAVWVSFATQNTLQIGNFHLAAVVLAVLAMLAFERRRHVGGGALLAFATLSKVFPGILVLYLLLERHWRAVVWTAVWAVVFTGAGLVVLGPGPFQAFLHYQLPRILSGEAFAFFESSAAAIADNHSIYGLVFKLKELGVPGMSRALGNLMSSLYTLALLVFVMVAVQRSRTGDGSPALLWLALLSLGALRSPFAPRYVVVSSLWLLALVACEAARRPARITLLVAVWLLLAIEPPLPWTRGRMLVSLVYQFLVVALNVWVILRRPWRDEMRSKMKPLLVATVLAFGLVPLLARPAQGQPNPPESVRDYVRVPDPVVALTHVRVIDGTGGAPKPDQTVVLEHGKIRSIEPAARAQIPAGAKVLALEGYSVIPGLVGMHDHMFYPSGHRVYAELAYSFPRLYLAGGVTTIRTTGSLETDTDIALKKKIDEGQLPGPKIHVTGPYLEGVGSPILQNHELAGPDEARKMVNFWADRGATSFKAYMHITRAELSAAIAAAHKRGLKVTGHLCSIGFSEAAALGIDNLEHGLFVDSEFVPGKAPDVCPHGNQVSDSLLKLDLESAPARKMIHELVQRHVAVTSTLPVFETVVPGRPPLRQAVLDAMAVPAQINYLAGRARRVNDPAAADHAALFKKELAFERAFVKAGGLLLAGLDPTGYGGVVAGFGDQREVELLVEAGFTPLEAIHIATANGAQFLGELDRIGTLQPGKQADLVVLNGDPVARIADIEKVEIVFKDGIGYDSAKLIESARGSVGMN